MRSLIVKIYTKYFHPSAPSGQYFLQPLLSTSIKGQEHPGSPVADRSAPLPDRHDIHSRRSARAQIRRRKEPRQTN
ncbi:hypothetical protein DESPIG_00473 [Desulfovibrio piger ATCC 29098]|uniref:Uncharacterized protein n=1 Tax=Desulfovibrio piger ATCC 29098 TaxID=411464 RepID=B6WQZ3_9BACT|nr:hypothetical protein DESPIG_00473 [Desulfovibrio piger ATCC 29098]